MKSATLAAALFAAFALVAADSASARGRSGGGGRSVSGHGGAHHSARSGGAHIASPQHFAGNRHFAHGGGFHGRVFLGTTIIAAPLFYPPPPPYYPYYYDPGYNYPSYPPAYIEQTPPSTGAQPQYWYYCPSSQAYYPYVNECPGGWQRVQPNTQPPQEPPLG